MFKKGAIQQTEHQGGKFSSSTFLVRKKDRKNLRAVNLKYLN